MREHLATPCRRAPCGLFGDEFGHAAVGRFGDFSRPDDGQRLIEDLDDGVFQSIATAVGAVVDHQFADVLWTAQVEQPPGIRLFVGVRDRSLFEHAVHVTVVGTTGLGVIVVGRLDRFAFGLQFFARGGFDHLDFGQRQDPAFAFQTHLDVASHGQGLGGRTRVRHPHRD